MLSIDVIPHGGNRSHGFHVTLVDHIGDDQFRVGALCEIGSKRKGASGVIGEGQGHEDFADIFHVIILCKQIFPPSQATAEDGDVIRQGYAAAATVSTFGIRGRCIR